jgi:hypothetical protein
VKFRWPWPRPWHLALRWTWRCWLLRIWALCPSISTCCGVIFSAPLYKIPLSSAFNSCRHHKEQRVDRGKQRGQRLRHWENFRVVPKWKTVQRIGCSWCALLDNSPWRELLHQTLFRAQLWRIKRCFSSKRWLLNGPEIVYLSGTNNIWKPRAGCKTVICITAYSLLVPRRLVQGRARKM